MPARRVVIYCRISQDREGAGLGVERQRTDCEALAKRLGWAVAAVHTDNDVSAYSGKPRPGYRALLDDLEASRATAVIAWHTDRLHRSPSELEGFVELCERRRVSVQTVKAGELDLSNPSGRMMARTLGAFARFEVEHKSERTRRAQEQAARAGRWLGGARPFGWQVRDGQLILDRTEAREVRRATAAVLAGGSLGGIVRDLNSRGVATSTGRPWSYATVRQMLTRPRNAGLSSYDGEIVGSTLAKPVVSEAEWRGVCALLADPARRRSTTNRVRHLLAGIALCGTCGTPLKSATVVSNRARGTTRTVYRCPAPGTGHVARSAGPVDEFVAALVIGRLSEQDVATALPRTDVQGDATDTQVEAIALRRRLTDSAEAFADGAISSAQLRTITGRVQEQLRAVESRMASSARTAALSAFGAGVDPGEVWAALPIDRQRAVIRELLTVRVLPSAKRGREFDPEMLAVEWRSA